MEFRNHPERKFKHLLSMPIIYGMIAPAIFIDVAAEIYHRLCFPLYGIPYINRSQYIRIDRQKLSRLNLMQKINCMYCGYMNGLFFYLTVIGARTEEYWCGIKHEEGSDFVEPVHQRSFEPRENFS